LSEQTFFADCTKGRAYGMMLLSLASVMTPTTNSSSGSQATVSTYYIGCCHLNESSTTVCASAATTTSCPSELLCWKTKTSSLECCINLEIDCHITPLTFILQWKLDSVLPVILIKFYAMLCYVSSIGLSSVTKCTAVKRYVVGGRRWYRWIGRW